MVKLKARGQKWLKGIHICFAGTWVGAAVSLVTLGWGITAATDGQLAGIDHAAKFIDDFVIIPAAFGSLLTGLAYALFTNWGFFRHRWVVVKWIITVGGIIFGTFWLGPWLNSLPPVSDRLGLAALTDPAYHSARYLNLWFGLLQVATLILAVFLSVLKPWKKKTSKQAD